MEDKHFEIDTQISSSNNEETIRFTEISIPAYEDSIVNTEIFVIHQEDVDAIAEITVNPNNSMKAKYSLIGASYQDKPIEIIPRLVRGSDTCAELIPRALRANDRETYLNIMYRGNSDVLTEIQPIGYHNMFAEIEVPPHNRMWALYEVQQPPIVTDIFNPTQDAATREAPAFESINYGANSSMVVGRTANDIWRSFVQFDLSSINPSYVLKETYLRLYYRGASPSHLKIEILNADSAWQEYNITNLNRPNPIDLISSDFINNEQAGYIEFDVLDIVKDWVALRKINNGFIIRLSNETESGQTTFYTRETNKSPELIVKYYDSRIFSQGRSQHLTEIFIYNANESTVETEITVHSDYGFKRIETEIYVHRVEVPLDSDILTEIIVTKPYVHTEIIASIREGNEVVTEINSRVSEERIKDVEITITKPYVDSEIYIKYVNAILTEITPRPTDESLVITEITVSKPSIPVEITPIIHDDSMIEAGITVTVPSIEAEIIVPIRDESHIFVEIEALDIWTSVVPVEIFINKDAIPIEITPRVTNERNLQTVIHVTKPKMEAEIEVKYRDDIWVEIEPNIKSDTMAEIIVSKPYIETSISVIVDEQSEHDAEIYVKYIDAVPTEIDAKAVHQIATEIDIKAVSQIVTELFVSRKIVLTEIMIPTWADEDLPTVIEPRILMVNNTYAMIQVGAKGGAYTYII
ncbi:DNRLRE domain-containing protein [Metasolibacillus meyeri]|uniref:DNRLRE domain-containing protein n=1 Tax=Metasolibacillus meyeri TaxID=1071052 RepID=A0AAW9NNY7_9BACL|nr:DNRLRE domain-containing protein [Metasolibacillus meyeri]MEC1179207.1 DNRLRE domain-containing protein [Metasolibacillus meyeri]